MGVENLVRAQSVAWHRDSQGKAPSYQSREVSGDLGIAMPGRDGKLLSTPSRLLKLLLPLRPQTSEPSSTSSEEPLALLVHPRQPLSYLERLIQAEIPPLEKSGTTRPPDIMFRARSPPDEGLVRWSAATEVGDFVRDASKSKEFILEIEGGEQLRVDVPSFRDQTRFLRQKLRAVSRQIDTYGRLKDECNRLAQRSAQQVAMGGFAALVSWWGLVWFLTFHTSLGWDVMEPVTYLAGLSTVMLGYLWFLYHNREVTYSSLLHLTVSRRQMQLYTQKGFDLERWQELLDEGKKLRKEIRAVAEEYDEEWDECGDEVGSERVKEVLDGDGGKKMGNEEE
ncbi:hypothetical protein FN846DRAFT_908241 [Sphaerosporella brunnea]|uniref:Calcium uniporter protein n=1 Tax=Sphaerosporella brunnea TaxID=1250544 RepID=A0A5J5EU70_9PEZI|nr:hypothetical protein FN846DRAFT_908241 [Sphaerosporella brunnea]